MEAQNSKIISPPNTISVPMINLKPSTLKLDPFIEKQLKNKKSDKADRTEELESRIKKSEDKSPDCMIEGFGNGDVKVEKDNTNKIQCMRCEYYFLKEEYDSHMTSHSSKILDFLYLGGLRNAKNLKELTVRTNIGYILNAAVEIQNYFPDKFQYLKLDMEDTLDYNIIKNIPEAIDFIESARNNQSRVLVHCQQGISRSATIVIAYLIVKQKMTLKDAFEYVKSIRNIVRPNLNFLKQLVEFEYQTRGEVTLDLTGFEGKAFQE